MTFVFSFLMSKILPLASYYLLRCSLGSSSDAWSSSSGLHTAVAWHLPQDCHIIIIGSNGSHQKLCFFLLFHSAKKRYLKSVQIVHQIEKKQWSDFDLAEKLSVLRTSGVIVFCLLLSSVAQCSDGKNVLVSNSH